MRAIKSDDTSLSEIDSQMPSWHLDAHRRLFDQANTWEQFRQCLTDPTDKHPCWQAQVIKGFPVGDQWRETICCNYLDHNKQCNNDLHYCVDHLEGLHQTIEEDLDYFADEGTFK